MKEKGEQHQEGLSLEWTWTTEGVDCGKGPVPLHIVSDLAPDFGRNPEGREKPLQS